MTATKAPTLALIKARMRAVRAALLEHKRSGKPTRVYLNEVTVDDPPTVFVYG